MPNSKLIATKFISAYQSPAHRVRLSFEGIPTLSKQSMQDECNVNLIMARYKKTGVIEHANNNAAKYQDNTGADFTTAMNIMTETQQMFDGLPSHIRNKFHNKPALFLDFVQNPDNEQEMIKLGLANKRQETAEEKPLEPEANIMPEK